MHATCRKLEAAIVETAKSFGIGFTEISSEGDTIFVIDEEVSCVNLTEFAKALHERLES